MTLISYAQNLEDIVLFRALSDVENGFYIDIGAYDPALHSVTKLFYDRGWHGINIEPVRAQFDRLQADRPRDINLNVAVAPSPGFITLYEVGGLSTTVQDIATRHAEAGFGTKPVTVPALTLESVMASVEVGAIHFLKIDIEGAEEAVITATRFQNVRPWIIAVEATAPLTQKSTYKRWDEHLVSEGYEFIYFDGLNRYYLAREQIARKERLGLQPNVFDEYKTSEFIDLEKKIEEGETWRQNLIASQKAYEDLQQRFQSLNAQSEKWRLRLLDAIELVRVRDDQLATQTTSAEQRILDVYRATSWRLTSLLRSIFARHPRLVRFLRNIAAAKPRVAGAASRAARGLRRLLTLRFPFPQWRSANRAASLAPATAPERVWFFLGDTIDWLASGQKLTGVGRVTAELFSASLQAPGARTLPSAFASNTTNLASLSQGEAADYLAAFVDAADGAAIAAIRAPHPTASFGPVAGDHVVFTGVVWSQVYTALFERLPVNGIPFSVFVYDIIPLEHPEYVSTAHHSMFAGWLRVVLTRADTIFVSALDVRDRILRWAALAEIPAVAQIVPVQFGVSRLDTVSAPLSSGHGPISAVRWDNFVLSVGTIDRRKNQAALCRLWPKLKQRVEPANLPQLVLVGRDDIALASISTEVAELMSSGDIVVLQGLADRDLAALYGQCLFTAFPSFSEGHGLPVAESLLCGKVCIATDLAVIREHAGDLPWYVPAGDDTALLEALHSAITDAGARSETERRIAETYKPAEWRETWQQIAKVVEAVPDRSRTTFVAPQRPDMPGLPPRVRVPDALHLAQQWCTESKPEVSILIINWNASALTMECIRHVWANTEGVSYEIIVADNGSDPASLGQLRHLGRGVHLLELGANRFFGEANNIAAEHAKGRFVCLLNNDAFVQPGWLKTLRDAVESNGSAGAAGPLFLFPDGLIQEAGGSIDTQGYPVRGARGEAVGAQALVPGVVDYISAAALLVRTECFHRVGGFDLTYEPAYYEDVDLCLKLRAIGRPVLFCPDAHVVHIEGAAANDDLAAMARRNALGDLNRSKFTARWSKFLLSRREEDLRVIAKHLVAIELSTPAVAEHQRRAVLFTPYALTPGGGERFLLSIASILSEDHHTTIVTSHRYSRMRLRELGRELAINLEGCHLATETEFLDGPAPDIQLTMGNHIAPPIPARGEKSVFLCQFPFPLDAERIRLLRDLAGPYNAMMAYSDYARAHILAAQGAHQMPCWPIDVVYPPVPQYSGDVSVKRPMILTVGRFFKGGHAKRHDLMIEAFRRLLERTDSDIEMHICGSSVPDPMHMAYLAELRTQAEGLPITFHVNASQELLAKLYREAAIYWHATGLDAPLAEQPWAAEHFGIAVVEAMSAGCVPMVFNAGGPREIVTDGVDGVLYQSLDDLVERAGELLAPQHEERRQTMANTAVHRARQFGFEAFRERVRALLLN